MSFDVIVIGGGPAGCAAAIRAARLGARVLLLERGRFPRHKVCGEFVSAESLELLRDLLGPSRHSLITDAPRIPEGRIFVNQAEIKAEINPAAASIARFDLDAALWDSSIQAGVEARADCAVRTVEGAGPFRIRTGTDSFDCRAVINASGRWSNLTSPVARALVNAKRWIGIKAHFYEAAAPNSVDLYFFDGGYCGVQPVGASTSRPGMRINACAMVRAEVATTLDEAFRCHSALLKRSRSWECLMAPVSTSPLVFHRPEPVHDTVFQVGDAATFVDPFIGDGISLALRSGALAAECLAPFFRNECQLPQAMAEYASLYQQRLTPVFRASSWLRKLLGWPAAVRKPVLTLLEKTPRITRQLVRMTR